MNRNKAVVKNIYFNRLGAILGNFSRLSANPLEGSKSLGFCGFDSTPKVTIAVTL
jgi:hypothetical protein